MNVGDVFRFVHIAEKHVWMIISDPSRDPHTVLMVNFTSEDPGIDQACLMIPGDHPFIVNRTLIDYARARITTNAALDALHSAGRLELLEPLSKQLLAKIRECAMQSTTIKLDYAEILITQELVD